MKRVIASILSCIMTLSCLPIQALSSYGEDDLVAVAYFEPNWKEMYANKLREIYDTQKSTDVYFDTFNYWALYDLNGDGIPELLHEKLSELFDFSDFDVYTVFDSNLRYAGVMSGYLYYDSDNNVFWTAACADGSDNEIINQYSIINGEMIQNFSMYYSIVAWNGDSEYVVNNENVSKEEYEKYAAKYNLDNYTPVDTYKKPIEHFSFSQIDEILAEEAVGDNDIILTVMNHQSEWQNMMIDSVTPAGDWYDLGFLDIDFDGELEFVISNTQGSGRYSSVKFYKIDSAKDQLTLFASMDETFIDFYNDIELYQDIDGNLFYLGTDYERAMYNSYVSFLNKVYYKNGLQQIPLFGEGMDAGNDAYYQYASGDYKAISKTAYDTLLNNFYLDNKNLNLTYMLYEGVYTELSKNDQYQVLFESYCAFGHDEPDLNSENNKKQFDPKTHGNSFIHYNKTGGGFEGVKNHHIPSNYVNSLTKYSSKYVIWKERNEEWNGSCHGVAMTMALNYNEEINIPKLSKKSAKDYYNMEKPCNNPDFLYTIEYYQIAQSLGTIKSDARVAYFTTIDHLKTKINPTYDTVDKALETIVKCTSDSSKAYVLSYFFPTIDSDSGEIVNEGHSIIACGCKYYSNNDTYEVTLFDENFSYKTEMIITGDFKKFRFIDGNNNYLRKTNQYYTYIGNMENDDKFITIELVDVTNYCDAPPNACNTSNSKKKPGATITSYALQTSNQVRLQFPVNSSFTLSNATGEYLTYNSKAIDLDMTVYDHSFVIDGESSEMVLFVDYSDYFLLESQDKATSFTVYNNDSLLSLENADVTEAEFDLKENQIIIEGRDFDFDAYLVSNCNASCQAGLLRISASADGTVNLSAQNNQIEIAADSVLENITALYL